MAAPRPTSGTPEWLDQVVEPIVDPARPIVDPHHHLWPEGGALPYGVDELVADTTSGHHVVATMFMECGAGYRTDGPERFRCVGETEFVAAAAADLAARHPDAPPIAGIVATAVTVRTPLAIGPVGRTTNRRPPRTSPAPTDVPSTLTSTSPRAGP